MDKNKPETTPVTKKENPVVEENKFDINQYFTQYFGLGKKPVAKKLNKQALIVAGIIFVLSIVLASTVNSFFGFFVVIGIIVAAVTLLVYFVKNRASRKWQRNYDYRYNTWDAECDKFYDKVVEAMDLKNVALKKSIIDEDEITESGAKPISITGQRYDGLYRYGKDGFFRTDNRTVSWIFFTEKQICVYTTTFSLTGKTDKTESTQEMFYMDITSVHTHTTYKKLKAESLEGETDIVAADEEFRLVVPGDNISFAMTASEEVSRTILAMKSKIRAGKAAKFGIDG